MEVVRGGHRGVAAVAEHVAASIGYDCGDSITHNPEFTRYGTSAADRAVLDGGLARAWTVIAPASGTGRGARLLDRLASRPAPAR